MDRHYIWKDRHYIMNGHTVNMNEQRFYEWTDVTYGKTGIILWIDERMDVIDVRTGILWMDGCNIWMDRHFMNGQTLYMNRQAFYERLDVKHEWTGIILWMDGRDSDGFHHHPTERRPLYSGPNESEQTCRGVGGGVKEGGGWGVGIGEGVLLRRSTAVHSSASPLQ